MGFCMSFSKLRQENPIDAYRGFPQTLLGDPSCYEASNSWATQMWFTFPASRQGKKDAHRPTIGGQQNLILCGEKASWHDGCADFLRSVQGIKLLDDGDDEDDGDDDDDDDDDDGDDDDDDDPRVSLSNEGTSKKHLL